MPPATAMATGMTTFSGPVVTRLVAVVVVAAVEFAVVVVVVPLVAELVLAWPVSSATLPRLPVLPLAVEALLVWPVDDLAAPCEVLAESLVLVFGLGLRQKMSHNTSQVTPAAMQIYTIVHIIRPAFEGLSCSYIVAALLKFSASIPQLLTYWQYSSKPQPFCASPNNLRFMPGTPPRLNVSQTRTGRCSKMLESYATHEAFGKVGFVLLKWQNVCDEANDLLLVLCWDINIDSWHKAL